MARRKRALTRIDRLLRSDGALCVTFVNTPRRQPIGSYDGLLAWSLEVGALAPESARRLAAAAAESPGAAVGVFRRSRTLLGRLERILLALAAGRDPAATDFEPFNAELRRAMGARELEPAGRRWCWGESEEDLDRMLWPVLLSAARVLTSKDRGRVRRCAQEGCDLFFIARGSGRPRRWCGPACRTRHSSRKHYHQTIKPRRKQIMKALEEKNRARLAGYGDE